MCSSASLHHVPERSGLVAVVVATCAWHPPWGSSDLVAGLVLGSVVVMVAVMIADAGGVRVSGSGV